MFKKLSRINQMVKNLHNPVIFDLEPYKNILEKINSIKLGSLSDAKLKAMSWELRLRADKGVPPDDLLVESFALVREASRRVLGMYPYDVQMLAGTALHFGKIVEMQTGEGKTLAAVMPAYLNALEGKGVHILTFNDYLAHRDAEWMGSIYKFLGLRSGYIKEGMERGERKKAYLSDIIYVTAKESGFDYLRDFLCTEKEQLVHRPFHYAIVDEADSILIDEARIPLVIAGNVSEGANAYLQLSKMVTELKNGVDYEIDGYEGDVYLTDAGLVYVEKLLECGNLYDSRNLELLTRLNCALHAEVLLKKDKDYIVRNGKIEIIDEFTGRVADKRHWPDNLQSAVEAKENLSFGSKGMIIGSVTLQHFLSLYPKISGMTGTAQTAAKEFGEFYGLDVVAIPTNRPCIRNDLPDMIFTHKEAKEKALMKEIKKVHKTGQPILVGTASIEESERLACNLMSEGVQCQVLNAKNDEMEAKIIAKAGELRAVTVSTNMAGRGIDIKLGGEEEQNRNRVSDLGGLYVIGTNRHESLRIDHQLRGRAGRQGDPGMTRFFLSLEDDWIKKYGIEKLIPLETYPQRQEEPVEDQTMRREMARGQRIVEGYNSDARRQLWKYSFIIEQQRQIIHNRRQDILLDKLPLQLLAGKNPQRYHSLSPQVGEEILKKVEKQLTLFYINKCWAEYLDYMAYIRESIHLVVMGNMNPIDEFHRAAIEGFDEMLDRIDREIVGKFESARIGKDGIDMKKEGLKGPSSTWTYLINDSLDQFSSLPRLIKSAKSALDKALHRVLP